MTTLFAIPLFAIAIGAALCSRLTRDDRNYYPMQKVFWFAMAAVYGGSGTAALFNAPTRPVVRFVFTLLMLGAVLYSLWFIRRRNRTPRFIELNLGGDMVLMSVEELDAASNLAESWAHHGTMTAERAVSLKAALAHWDAHQGWRERVTRQAAAHRATKGR